MNQKIQHYVASSYAMKEGGKSFEEYEKLATYMIGLFQTQDYNKILDILDTISHYSRAVLMEFFKGYEKYTDYKGIYGYINCLLDFKLIPNLDTEKSPEFKLFRTLYFEDDTDYVETFAWHLLRSSVNGDIEKCKKIVDLVGTNKKEVLTKYRELKDKFSKFLK